MCSLKVVKNPDLADYLEAMSFAGFQAGISWRVVDAKWPGIRAAFKDFDPAKVARFSGDDVDRLMADAKLIRNRRKLEGVVLNARRLLELDKEYGGFGKYLRSLGSYEEKVAALHKEFKFLGESGAYFFLWKVGETVSEYESWLAEHDMKMPVGHHHSEK